MMTKSATAVVPVAMAGMIEASFSCALAPGFLGLRRPTYFQSAIGVRESAVFPGMVLRDNIETSTNAGHGRLRHSRSDLR